MPRVWLASQHHLPNHSRSDEWSTPAEYGVAPGIELREAQEGMLIADDRLEYPIQLDAKNGDQNNVSIGSKRPIGLSAAIDASSTAVVVLRQAALSRMDMAGRQASE